MMNETVRAQTPEQHSQPAPNITLIASGKGGVGKTWFTISLAHQLASDGKRVLIFDGDLGLANIDIQLGINPNHDLGDVIEGTCSFRDAITTHPIANTQNTFDILPGRSGTGSLAQLPLERLSLLREDLKALAGSYDHVFIDLGAGIGGIVKSLTPAAAKCILVMNDEPTSLTDGYAFLKVTKRNHPELDISILINAADSQSQGESTFNGFNTVCKKFLNFSPHCIGIIRRDHHIKDAIRHQTALITRHPNSDAVKDVSKIAKQV